jgi:hypothetical protein
MADLEFGSRLSKRFFAGRFLLGPVTTRMVQFSRHSPRFRGVMQDLFAGRQSYLGLKRRLFQNLNRTLVEIALDLVSSGITLSLTDRPRRHQH